MKRQGQDFMFHSVSSFSRVPSAHRIQCSAELLLSMVLTVQQNFKKECNVKIKTLIIVIEMVNFI